MALGAGILFHIDTRLARRAIASELSNRVSDLLVSNLVIEDIESISTDRLLVSRAALLDHRGNVVFEVQGLDARFELLDVLSGALAQDGVRVVVPDVRVHHVRFELTRDEELGELTVATAFDLKSENEEATAAPVFVALPAITAESAEVRANLPGLEQARAHVGHLVASLDVSPERTRLLLSSKHTRVTDVLPRPIVGKIRGDLRFPGPIKGSIDVRAGKAPVSGAFRVDDGILGLELRSEDLSPDAMLELVGAWPLSAPVRFSARARGPLASMSLEVTGRSDNTELLAEGQLALEPSLGAKLDVRTERLDLRLFAAGAPETSLSARADVEIRVEDDVRVRANGTVAATQLSGYPIPALGVHASYADESLRATITSQDRRLPASIEVGLTPEGRLDWAAMVKYVPLAALAPYGVAAGGWATARAEGSVADRRLAARFAASGRSVELDGARLASAKVRGRVQGPLDTPGALRFDVRAKGNGLAAGAVNLRSVEAVARGSLGDASVSIGARSEDGVELRASGRLALGNGVVARDLRVHSERAGLKASLEAKRAVLEEDHVEVQEIALRSNAGRLSGSVTWSPTRRAIDVTATDVDVAKTLEAFGIPAGGFSGEVNARVDVTEAGRRRSGRASLSIRQGAIPSLGNIEAELEARFHESTIHTAATARIGVLLDGTVLTQVRVPGSITDRRALEKATGRATLRLSKLDLHRIGERFLAQTGLSLAGTASGALTLIRTDPALPPTTTYEIETRDLLVRRASEEGEAPDGVRLDIRSRGRMQPTSASQLSLDVVDGEGAWIKALAEPALGVREVLELLRSGAAERLLDTPVRARIDAFPRPLAILGDVAGRTRARFQALLGVTGTLRHPELNGSVSIRELEVPGLREQPAAMTIAFQYAGDREAYTFEGLALLSGHERAQVGATGHLGWPDEGLARTWSARGHAIVDRFDLGRFSPFLDLPLTGTGSARLSFDVGDGRLDADSTVSLDSISIDGHGVGNASARVSIRDGRTRAQLSVAEERSILELSANARLAWKDGGPNLDSEYGGAIEARARDFDLVAISPFLRGLFRRLSGLFNCRARIQWEPRTSAVGDSTLDIDATLTDGTLELAAAGGLIENIQARATTSVDGRVVELALSGSARSRKPNIRAKAKARFAGLRPTTVKAQLRVDHFPLVSGGVPTATATVAPDAPPIQLTVEQRDETDRLDLTIPDLEIGLPDTTRTRLIGLEPDPAVTILERRQPPEPQDRVETPSKGPALFIRLGKSVRLKKSELLVFLEGQLQINPSGTLKGKIVFPEGGVVPALGNVFRIRRGMIRFDDEPAKAGDIFVEASTQTPDGTDVLLQVAGTLDAPSIRLVSDPPQPEAEIIALLLGVQPEDAYTQQGQAQSVGGAALALAMNQLLQGSPLSGLQFGTGQTREGESVTTASARVGRKVWVEGRSVRSSQSSLNPEDRVSGVVDWRFAPNWSLRTQFGQVSGVELRWSRRY